LDEKLNHWFDPHESTHMSSNVIVSPQLAPPVGPFSHAVRADSFIYVSGQVGQHPATGNLVAGGVAAETEQALSNLAAVLQAAGKSFEDVVKAGVFLRSMEDFAAMNSVYARYFSKPYPARTTIAVAGLPLGASVEIDLIVRA
jgi:2-iminobutanoate/2-iminopropanoate deaminase